MEDYRLPIVIGITGHRDILPECRQPLYERVVGWFEELKSAYPGTPVQVLDSLAPGADLLCAQAALACGLELIAPLPMDSDVYQNDFSEEELPEYLTLMAKASSFVVPKEYGEGYAAAGRYVARHCHILLALWDGRENNTPDGAGTYETIKQKLEYGAHPLAKGTGVVLQLVTPRAGNDAPAQVLELLPYKQPFDLVQDKVLGLVKQFNDDAEKHVGLIEKVDEQNVQYFPGHPYRRVQGAFSAADAMALNYQKARVRTLAALSLCGLLLVLFFLFYDELNAPPMLFFYGGFLVFAFLLFRVSSRYGYHQKFLLYRMVAETIRVKLYLLLAGMEQKEFPHCWWQQDDALRFARQTFDTAAAGAPAQGGEPVGDVRQFWVGSQQQYHKRSLVKKGSRYQLQQRLSFALLLMAVGFFVIVALVELLAPGLMLVELKNPFRFIFPFTDDLTDVNSMFKIVLGGISAAAAFLANYFGKLDIDEQMQENDRMRHLYFAAGQQLNTQDAAQKKEVVGMLADAAITENLNWYHYNQNKAPEFTVD